MIPSPILPEDLDHVDLVLATHRHSDHMDPETLPALAKRNPDCQFILPRSERAWAGKIGIPESQTIALNDGEAFVLEDQISINGIASAHEEIRTNQKGEHHFLGYVLGLGPVRIYHSGDCTPYPGLISKIADHKIKLALLPINGRDDYRRRRSIPGNFTVDEAVDLCLRAGVGVLLGHHYGMFSFNTIEEEEAERVLRGPFLKLEGFLARLGLTYVISK
jgi:L-ascorbate metabolism protein UlaG (beta-lactamase superfamily)